MSSSAKPVSAVEILAVILLSAVCLAAVLWRIGNPALWLDEHISLAFTQESWTDLFGRLWSVDTHRPVYYALLKGWMELVGTSRTAARTLGGVFALLTVPLVWLIGRMVGNQRIGLLSAALVALSPMFIAQARELRMYPLFTFALMGVMLALVLILQREGNRKAWGLFVFSAALAFYAQAIGLLVVPMIGMLFLGFAGAGLLPKRRVVEFVAAAALWLILIFPGLSPMLFHTSETLSDFWIPAPSLGWVWSQFTGAYPYPVYGKPLVLLALVGGFIAIWRQDRRAFWLFLTVIAGMPILLWGLSYLRPILIVRVFIWTTLVSAIVMAFALDALRTPWRYIGLGLLLGLQILVLRPLYPAAPLLTDLDRLAPAINHFDPINDIMILSLVALEPNLRWNHPEMRTADLRAFSHGDRPELFANLLWSDHLNRTEATRMPLEAQRVWLISETDPMFLVPEPDRVEPALEAIRARGTVTEAIPSGRLLLEVIVPDP